MNRFGWFVLNVALVAVVCGVALLLGESDPSAHWTKVKESIVASATSTVKTESPAPVPEPVVEDSPARYPIDSKTADVLWQHTLFNPDRTEDSEIKASADADKQEKAPEYAFEVRGIMMINDQRVVSLSVKQQSVSHALPPTLRNRRPTLISRRGTPAPPEKPKNTTHVYHEGDKVEDTGYVVTSIAMDSVTLKRGEEELVLSVDLNDDMSKQRRDSAAKAEAARVPPKADGSKSTPVVSTLGTTKGAPPPPPPAPGAALKVPTRSTSASPSSGETLEQRLQRIRERREQLLKQNEKRRTTK